MLGGGAGVRTPGRAEKRAARGRARTRGLPSARGSRYSFHMQATEFDEEELFSAIARSGVRALLIGRRALVALGIPVLTADYDLWIHIDDIAALNAAVEPLELYPNRPPDEARRLGRYVLEGDEKVDVLVARQASTKDGVPLRFEDAWARRTTLAYTPRVPLVVPCLDDMILTKRWSLRPKDVDDIAMLEKLKKNRGSAP
jgi:hypothetical protein